MRTIRVFIFLVCLSMVLPMLACSSEKISNEITSQTLESDNTSMVEEINSLKQENADLKLESANLKTRIAKLEIEVAQANQSDIDDRVRYDLEVIIEMMGGEGHKIELFTAEIESVRFETTGGTRRYFFKINRHQPGWGWEASMGEESAGYPVKAEVQGGVRVIFNYRSFRGHSEDLVDELNGNREKLKFLMIDNSVVFITEQRGP